MSVDLVDIYNIAVEKLSSTGLETKQNAYVSINQVSAEKGFTVNIPVNGDNDQIISVSYNEIAKYRELKSNSTICNSIW
jgi:hypothetical protein